MTIWRRAGSGTVLLFLLVWSGCGDQFRPVAVPISPPPPNPQAFNFVQVISDNGPHNPGASTRIDVSGDTNIGVATLGLTPVHAAILPNRSRIYAANNGEDTVSSWLPSSPGTTTTTSLPIGARPVFVNTTENGTVYVANLGTSTLVPPTPPSVAAIATNTNVVSNNIILSFMPMTLAETPDGKKVYAVGSDSSGTGWVISINSIDQSLNEATTGSVIPNAHFDPNINAPIWVVTRSDNQRAYVLNSGGSGAVSTVDTSSDTVVSDVAVGPGANFMLYDNSRNRLYVTNPVAGTVIVLDASADPPKVLTTISLNAGPNNNQCTTGWCPVSMVALADGSRAYVVSYQVSSPTCLANQPCSITSQVSVINASSNTVSSVIPLGTVSVDTTEDTSCNPATSTHPARFRLSVAAAADSSKVYVASCDAGSTVIVQTSDDSLIPDPTRTPPLAFPFVLVIPEPLSAFPSNTLDPCQLVPSSTGSPSAAPFPPCQNPVFVLTEP